MLAEELEQVQELPALVAVQEQQALVEVQGLWEKQDCQPGRQ